jgi:hypothetical protein
LPAWTARAAAALIALICWTGIALQFSASYEHSHDVFVTLWTLARFFTIIGNFALALFMTKLALGGRVSPFVVGGLTLAIALVGMVYVLLLRGLHPLSGRALAADYLLHYASPIAMAAYWLAFTPHGRLRWTAPLWWVLFPLTYFIYAIARGEIDGRYPYPFMDVTKLGLARALLNGVAIAAAFIAAGFAVVWADRRLLGPREPSG